MRKEKPPYKQNDDLLARLQLQDELIRNFEKEIYENVGQVLCLARIKLVNVDVGNNNRSAEILQESGNLIGKAISDLRNLVKEINKL